MKEHEQNTSPPKSIKERVRETFQQLINRQDKEEKELIVDHISNEEYRRRLRRSAKKIENIFPEMTRPGRCGGCDIIIDDH